MARRRVPPPPPAPQGRVSPVPHWTATPPPPPRTLYEVFLGIPPAPDEPRVVLRPPRRRRGPQARVVLAGLLLAGAAGASSPPPTAERCDPPTTPPTGAGRTGRPVTPPAPCVTPPPVPPPGPTQIEVAAIQATWAKFTDRLAAGDVDGAMALVNPRSRPRLADVVATLLPDLAAIVHGWTALVVTDVDRTIAEGVITQPATGGDALHFVFFIRDATGQWLVDGM